MDIAFETQDKDVRKIEDIIDIQKANGNIRQVAFKLPSETNSNISINFGKSLESGLSRTNKKKERRQKYKKDSDVISWPSDSDITVLRMKLFTQADEKMDSVALGDGLHQPQSSSMVNLATLMLQSQRASKHSLDVEEYLLPLTSWEHAIGSSFSENTNKPLVNQTSTDFKSFASISSQKGDISEYSTKSKVARFLRLYFCPCCACLYKVERMRDKQPLSLEIVGGK